MGPLTSEEGNPLFRLGITPATEIADVIGPGAWQVDLWHGYSNIFEQDSAATHEVFLDAERLISSIAVRRGIGDRFEVGARLTLETTGPGFLDGFIEGYHDLLGLPNANREQFPRGRFAQRFWDGSGRVRIDIPSGFFALEDVRLFAKWGALARPGGALSLRAVLRLPTRSNRRGDENVEGALVALGRRSWTRWHLHAGLGVGTMRSSESLDPLLESVALFSHVALERELGDSWSAVVQLNHDRSRFRDVGEAEVDGSVINVLFGVSGRMGPNWSWDVSFQEDVPTDRPSVDFTLGLRVSRRWQVGGVGSRGDGP